MAKKNSVTVRFEDMTKAELLAMCREFGLEVSPRAKKDQIISILMAKTRENSPEEGASLKGKGSAEATQKKTGKAEAPAPEVKDASKDDTLWDFMHSMDGIQPRVVRSKREIHREDPQAAASREESISESDMKLAQSRDDVYSPLQGIVDGCSSKILYVPDEKTGEKIPFVYVRVSFMDKIINIPTYAFWDDAKNTRKYPEDRLISNINHRMDSVIDFNFAFAQEDRPGSGLKYYGTRLLAMKNKRADTWYAKMTDGSWYMKEGDIAEARVAEVWPKHVILEISGVETVLHREDVSRKVIEDLTNDDEEAGTVSPVATPGTLVQVKITEIRRKPMPANLMGFDYPVSIRASMAELEEDPNEKYFDDYTKGDTSRAFIKNITTDLEDPENKTAYYCELLGNGVTVRCYMAGGLVKAGVEPKKGGIVRLRITGKKITPKGEHWIYGEIFRVVKGKKKEDVAFMVNRYR